MIDHGECIWPFCTHKNQSCECGYLKKIPLNFYNIKFIEEKLCMPIKTCDLLSNSDDGRSDLVFGNKEIFPLEKLNETKYKLVTKRDDILMDIIERRLKG